MESKDCFSDQTTLASLLISTFAQVLDQQKCEKHWQGPFLHIGAPVRG